MDVVKPATLFRISEAGVCFGASLQDCCFLSGKFEYLQTPEVLLYSKFSSLSWHFLHFPGLLHQLQWVLTSSAIEIQVEIEGWESRLKWT
jgi:hypothetical protein